MMIIKIFRILINRIRWRLKNRHNKTVLKAVEGDSIEVVSVGKCTYGKILVLAHSRNSALKIGSFCSIAPEVSFLLGSEHPIHNLSSYPFKVQCLNSSYEAKTKGDIIVEDDVWIGYRTTILSGVNIGQGAVIAAGAVVTTDVPPYAIVGGIPARVINYRFNQETIDYLLTLDFSLLNSDDIKNNIDDLYTNIHNMSLDDLKMAYNWFPKK